LDDILGGTTIPLRTHHAMYETRLIVISLHEGQKTKVTGQANCTYISNYNYKKFKKSKI
jgi:hypothetical protein